MTDDSVRHLVVQARNNRAGHAFANTPEDDGDSVLLLMRHLEIPVCALDDPESRFGGTRYYQHSGDGQLPKVGDRVVCKVESHPKGDFAVAWTYVHLWESNETRYALVCKNGKQRTPLWEGYGVLRITELFATDMWRRGTIAWFGDTALQLLIVREIDGEKHFFTPAADPRLPAKHLSWLRAGEDRRHPLLQELIS